MMLAALALWSSLASPVVGGAPVSPGEFPDVVLVAGWTGLCSGTLIAPDVVLTAGHCVEIDPQVVLVGSVDFGAPAGQLVVVASATAYPDWPHAYDVAVLVLAEPVLGVTPRAIAAGCAPAVGDEVRLVGFGLTDPAGSGSNARLSTALLTVDDPACTDDPACEPAIAPDGELVAGGGGKAACFGDSGGPLLAGSALLGVVSRGTGSAPLPCGGAGVYVRADAVAPWIEQTTGRRLARAPCALDAPTAADGCNASSSGGTGPSVAILAVLGLRRRRRA